MLEGILQDVHQDQRYQHNPEEGVVEVHRIRSSDNSSRNTVAYNDFDSQDCTYGLNALEGEGGDFRVVVHGEQVHDRAGKKDTMDHFLQALTKTVFDP